jgi:hypothetical protein
VQRVTAATDRKYQALQLPSKGVQEEVCTKAVYSCVSSNTRQQPGQLAKQIAAELYQYLAMQAAKYYVTNILVI